MKWSLSIKRNLLVGFILLVVSALAASGTLAQTATTSLRGSVTDPSGASISGAKVSISNRGTGFSRETATSADGVYEFLQLPPATYALTVSAPGFKTYERAEIILLVSTPSTVDVRMEVGAIAEKVLVSEASAPAINTSDATVGNSFSEREVKELPFLARNVVNLLTLQPGVVFTGQSDTDLLSVGTITSLDLREGSVNGVRGNQTNVTVDGADSNDWQNQSPFTSALPVTLDSVEEFRVTTTNANATDGVVSGPEVTLVTKSGNNNFHGNVRWYYRTSGATANPFFNKTLSPIIPRAKLQRQIPGGSLGGPIKKDRFFFFLDTEERREASSEPVLPRQVPSNALRDGVLVYQCADATDSRCQGSTVQGLTGSHIIPAGAFGLRPSDFQSLDPAGTGVNSAMVSVLNLYPSGNNGQQGLDQLGGNALSFNGFVFNAPILRRSAIQTARVDYKLTSDARHTVYWRGTLGDYHFDLLDAQFPGQNAASTLLNNSKGFTVRYQGQFGPRLINTAGYSLTRLGVEETGAQGTLFDIRSFSDLISFNRGNSHRVPVKEISDDVTYIRGTHSLQLGGSFRWIRNKRVDLALSFPGYVINNGFCVNLCDDMVVGINGGTSFPAVANPTLFERAAMALTGSITQVSATFLADPKTGNVTPAGTPELRQFAEDYVEVYAQDSWRLRPSLTLTYGLRYGYETPPWEVNGLQVAPNTDIMQWFQQRIANMNNGLPSDASPLLSWVPSGKANGKDSWYAPNRKDFAPRLALAYAPSFANGLGHSLFGEGGKTSIRLGAGLYYDRIGQALAVDSDLNGSPGTATSLINGSQTFSLADAPRFSGSCTASGQCTGLPPLATYLNGIPTKATFPFQPTPGNVNLIGFAIDPHLKSPYTIHLTASVQRQLPRNFVVDVAYVGSLGRRLLGKFDYAQYLNLRDPQSKTDLWGAFRKIVNIIGTPGSPSIDPTNIAALSQIASIPYFDHLLPNMPAFTAAFTGNSAYNNVTPTQAFYAYVTQDTVSSWSCALFPMDALVGPAAGFGLPSPWSSAVDPQGDGLVLFQSQFVTMPGWANFANSNYHSLQVSVRKTAGFATLGFNYVLSHSIDNSSGAENGDLNPLGGTFNGLIQNPFDLRAGRGLSDFDVRHNFNANWVIDLPFGKGHRFGGGGGRLLDSVIGGWNISGLMRWRSGFPQSPGNGFNFPTNFFLTTPGTVTATIGTSVVRNCACPSTSGVGAPGLPNLFRNPAAALNAIAFTAPGLSGSRNIWRGPAYMSVDSGLAKSFRMPWRESHRLRFRVTAFNVFNQVNFADSESLDPTAPSVFGQFIATAGPRGGAREVEFGARYEF